MDCIPTGKWDEDCFFLECNMDDSYVLEVKLGCLLTNTIISVTFESMIMYRFLPMSWLYCKDKRKIKDNSLERYGMYEIEESQYIEQYKKELSVLPGCIDEIRHFKIYLEDECIDVLAYGDVMVFDTGEPIPQCKLMVTLSNELIRRGYFAFEDNRWNGMFCKYMDDGLFFTLSLEYEDCNYDYWKAYLFLSKVPGSVLGRSDTYVNNRLDLILTPEQRKTVGLSDDSEEPRWKDTRRNTLHQFYKCLDWAESNLLSDSNLKADVENSPYIKEMHEISLAVIACYMSHECVEDLTLRHYEEKRIINGVPKVWVQCAEKVLGKLGCDLSSQTVHLAAEMAYRYYVLTHVSE